MVCRPTTGKERMPSLFSTASIFGKRLVPQVDLKPWSWVAFIFGAQTLGASIIIQQFELSFEDVAPAMILLMVGFLAAMVFRRYDSPGGFGSWRWWIPVCIYCLFIFSLSSRSYPEARTTFSTTLFHPVEYLTLGIFLSFAWRHLVRLKGTRFFILTVLISGILFGMSDELHQAFTPGRTARISDVMIDSLSVAVGMGVCWVAWHARKPLT